MTIRNALLALGALFAGNALAASSFSIYFNGESQTANCHVDNVSNAQLSTTGSGNLVATASTPLAFSSACGISGGSQQLTFGPAQPLVGPSAALASGSNVTGNFSVLPLNASSCTVAFNPTTNVTGPVSGYVCGSSGSQSCTSPTPIPFSANFTNTGASATSWQATVNCVAATGANPANLASNAVTVTQNGNSGGTPTANFTCNQTSSLTIGCTDQSTDPGSTIGSWSWDFGDRGTSTQQNPSHAYASAGSYTVTLTVADSVNPNNKSTQTHQVQVTTGGATSCTTGQTGDISGYTALCYGKFNLYTPSLASKGPSAYSYDFVFGALWPGVYLGQAMQFATAATQFVSVPFVASPGHTMVFSVNNTYTSPGGSAAFSISTQPGLFNGGNANGTTVLCVQSGNSTSLIASSNGSTANCVLNTTGTYWLNMVNGVFAPSGGFVGCKSNCSVAVNLTQNN